MNKILLKKVQDRLSEIGIKYDTNDTVIHFGMDIGDVLGNIRIYIDIADDYILTYAVINNKCPTEHISKTAEYLHRANYGLIHGNFEIDYNDGEIRYKILATCQDTTNIPNSIIDRCVFLPCKMLEKYGKGIIKTIINEGDPKKLIEEAEQD